TNIRKFGKIAFIVIKDGFDHIQLFLSSEHMKAHDADPNNSELSYDNINLLDSGDFIEIAGIPATSKSGEKSINVDRLRILAKSIRPMPLAQEGFTNKEERLRRRYIDANVNKDVYERFIRRSK